MTRALGWLAALALVIGLGAAFGYAPREAVQGNVQRIMYLHVPAVLFLVYVGYLLLRGMVDEPDRRARYAAVVGILGAANIPIVHFSVKWWRALHQPSTILGPEPSPIAAPIALTLLVNWIAFTLLFLYFLARRAEIARLEESHAG